MPRINEPHDTMLAGLAIQAGIVEGRQVTLRGASGTLTGLAAKEDGTLVLVTNAHVMASVEGENPTGNEDMYQPGIVAGGRKVGVNLDAHTLLPLYQHNTADIAACELASGVVAEFAMHNNDEHSGRRIIAGTREPENGMQLTMLGGASGERIGVVESAGGDGYVDIDGRRFSGLFALDCGESPVQLGDSGSPLLLRVAEGVYRMVGVAMSRYMMRETDEATGERVDKWIVWAFPASMGERALRITFGEQLKDLSLLASQGFNSGIYTPWVRLAAKLDRIETHGASRAWIGAGGAWTVSFTPRVDANAAFVSVSIHGAPNESRGFVAGKEHAAIVYLKRPKNAIFRRVLSGFGVFEQTNDGLTARFNLPLTDDQAKTYADYFEPWRLGDFEVAVQTAPKNRKPFAYGVTVPEAVNVGARVVLDGIGSHDLDGGALEYQWRQLEGGVPVTIENAGQARAEFTAPDEPTTLHFSLTVTDEYREKEQSRTRTSNFGNTQTQTRWVTDE